MHPQLRRRVAAAFGPIGLGMLAVATLWSAALVVAGATLSAYGGQSESMACTAGARCTEQIVAAPSQTLVQANGLGVLAPLSLPLLATLVVAVALWRRHGRGRPGAGPVAWTAAAAMGALTLLGVLTIGLFLLPVAACLVVTCAVAEGRRP